MDLARTLLNQQRQLAKIFADLTAEEFTRASLCREFSMHFVLAHLVAQLEHSALKQRIAIIRAKRDRPLAQLRRATTTAVASPSQLLTRYESLIAASTPTSERRITMTLADTVIHTVDVCRPLGRTLPPMEFDFAPVLSFLASDTALLDFVAAPLPNVTFVATNTSWRAGRGPEVVGDALDLALAMTARPNATRGLRGPGVESVAQWARVHGR